MTCIKNRLISEISVCIFIRVEIFSFSMIRLTRLRYLFSNNFKIKSDINQRIVPKYATPIIFHRAYSILGHEYKPYALLRTFKSTPETLTIQFQDGLFADYFCIWLRDSCGCQDCIHTETKEKKLDTISLDLSIAPRHYHITKDGRLKIVWPGIEGEHTSYYDPSWLHRYALGFYDNVYERVHNFLPTRKYWNADYLNENLPTIEYEELTQTDRGIYTFLVKFHELGIVILKNVPCKAGEVIKLMNKVSHIMITRWGSSFDDAYNNHDDGPCVAQDLYLHTDMDYLEKSPGVKVIHCLDTKVKDESKSLNVEGNSGKSYFVDGFYVARWIKENYPLYFKTLSEVPVKFQSISEKMFYINYQPILTLNKSRDVTEVHFNNGKRAPLEGPPSSILNFYAAYNLFGENVRKPENQFGITLNPGDVIILNNRRILHGNKGYDTSEISTHFEASYANMDDILARYRLICTSNELNKGK